jgi:DHA1 family tetracycline resistance protein-like MFS transporter
MSEAAAPRVRRAALIFALITVWIDVLSWGVTIPVYPALVAQHTGGDASKTAAIVGIFLTLFSAVQLFAAPVLGALSDRYGRRPIILFACMVLAFDLALMAFAPDLIWLAVTRIIHAVAAASFSAANAYIADVTRPEERAKAFGYLGAAFSFGIIVGPGLGGILGQIDIRLPFLLGAVFAFINAIYGFFILPESLKEEHRRPFKWNQASPIGALNFLRADPIIFALACVLFLAQLAQQVYPALWVLYTAYRYQWDAMMVGITLAISGGLGMIAQTFFVEPIVNRIGERMSLIVGFGSIAVAFLVCGWAPNQYWFLLAMPLGTLASIAGPAVNSMLTSRVGPDKQGQLQGANAALISVAGLVGPLIFAGTFAYFIAPERGAAMPGIPFYIAAVLMALAVWLAAYVTRPAKAAA